MKKYILLLYFLFLLSLISFGQTNTHIISGTISTPTVWNGYDTYYIDTYITITTGGSLTINPLSGSSYPVKIIFTNSSYGITIESSGSLTVNGTSSRNVIFNADANDNGTHDSGETWKNLSFDGSSGTSLINYAVIEYGTGDGYGYGGGIDIYGFNLTVKNSIIRHCSCLYDGGGISVTGNNFTLENLTIHDNSASGSGGGVDLEANITLTGCVIYNNSSPTGDGIYANASSTVTNCSVYGHSSGEGIYVTSSGTSIINSLIYGNTTGVYFASSGSLVNCDVVSNGTGVNSVSGTAPVLLNTAIWGNTSVQYTGTNIALANCGIQGGFTTGTNGGGNINLNSSNTNDAGPNFVDPATPDFHINSWITQLVDGGTASYSGVNAPANDRDGQSTLVTKDIGAYEFFYYLWTGVTSTDWSTASNWTGSPSSVPTSFSENKVYIPKACTYYPVTSSLTLSNRSTVIIDPLASLTVTGATTVDAGCTFYINADATGSANFKTGSSVTGSFNTQIYLTGGGAPDYNWHYVCPPVNSSPKSILTTAIGNSYNLLNYIETRVTGTDRNTGWNWHDTYNSTPGFSNLYTNLGYNVYVATDHTALFTGTILYEQDLNFSSSDLTYSGGTSDPNGIYGWNLIGNPFTCSADAAGFTFGANIDPTIYFTRNNIYCSYNVVTHASLNGATNFIPAMQGFFVHATNGSARTLTIPASSRTNLSYKLYYKGKGAKESYDYPLVKFNVSNGSSSDEALIYFFKDAVSGFDRNYDTYKMFAENPALPQIYTVSNDIKLGMNGLPFPDKITVVPLKIKISEAKDYTINILDLLNLDDYNVTLVHGDKRTDLKTNPVYSFYATAGVIDNMSIIFSDISLGITDPVTEQTSCWYTDRAINIKTGLSGFENKSLINIFDLNGKLVFSENNVSIPGGEIFALKVNLPKGLYIVSVSNNGLKVTKKVVITY
jgi:hypothetical protein